MDVSIILVSYNTATILAACLERLQRSTPAFSREIIVVDNASRDRSAELVRTNYPECHLVENSENRGFGRACNQALQWATGRYVLLLNTDAFVEPDAIEKTIGYMDTHPDCGILGAKLVGSDGGLQPSARYFPTPWNAFLQRSGLERFAKGVRMVDDMNWDHASVRRCDWVTGCFYLVRRAVIDQIGLFDPRYFLYCEEVDHCFAAKKAGWSVIFFPHTTVVHMRGESAKSEGEVTQSGHHLIESANIESELLYFRKNHGVAGALAHVLLTMVVDLLNLLKSLVKRTGHARHWAHARHVALVWSLYRRTRWATLPTR